MRNESDAAARRAFFERRNAHEVDSPDLPDLDPQHPIVDTTGEANNHFDLNEHEKELAAQPVDRITNKLTEAQSTPGLPNSVGFHEAELGGQFDQGHMSKLDEKFGKNNWLVKPWDPEEPSAAVVRMQNVCPVQSQRRRRVRHPAG